MAGWFDALMNRFRRSPPRGRNYVDDSASASSFAAFDYSNSSAGGTDDPLDLPNADDSSSFENAFDGGRSGGAGASDDYGGGWDSGGGGEGGGGGDGGGGGGGGGGD